MAANLWFTFHMDADSTPAITAADVDAAWDMVTTQRALQSKLANARGVKGITAKRAAAEARHQELQTAYLNLRAAFAAQSA